MKRALVWTAFPAGIAATVADLLGYTGMRENWLAEIARLQEPRSPVVTFTTEVDP